MTPTKIRSEEEAVIPKEVAAVDRRVKRAMTMSTNPVMTPTKIRSEAAAEDLEMKILTPAHYWKMKSSSKM